MGGGGIIREICALKRSFSAFLSLFADVKAKITLKLCFMESLFKLDQCTM